MKSSSADGEQVMPQKKYITFYLSIKASVNNLILCKIKTAKKGLLKVHYFFQVLLFWLLFQPKNYILDL